MKQLLIFALILPLTLYGRYYTSKYTKTFTLMLNPAGDARQTGRKINDTFERGITLQYAEKLKEKIEEQYPFVAVTLTRLPGEIVYPLQHANFANRLNINLYVSLHFYRETETKPTLYLYGLAYQNDFATLTQELSLYPYDQAHLYSKNQTDSVLELVHKSLTKKLYNSLFTVHGPYKIPFKPLIGIKTPAIAIEAGLKDGSSWKSYLEPLVESIGTIITFYNEQ